jgi:hypothetical protein
MLISRKAGKQPDLKFVLITLIRATTFVKYVRVLDLNQTDKYWFAPFCVAKRALTAAQYIGT